MKTPSAVLTLFLSVLAAQATAVAETETVVAGPQYRASGFHRFLFGDDYRDLWTTPIAVERLDLRSFAGGLKPVRRVGGQETKGLALHGADGRDYTFRSIDKDPGGVLPPDLQDTIAERIVRDQIAASHPAAPVVADRLLEAAGVLHSEHRLVVMPDDPALGEFRPVFAGLVGTIEVYPRPVSPENPGFAGATRILNHKDMYELLQASPADRVDARAFLTARLMDVLMGDWDRHRDQWRWAKIPGREGWQPIPEDRDMAFARFDGVVLALGRGRQPRFVEFRREYPSIVGLTWNGWEQDRQLLAELERPVWEETAAALKGRITDAVVDEAVRRMPAEYYRLNGARLAAALKSRRDQLPAEAMRFYRLLAAKVEVHGTDQAETVTAERLPGGDLDVRIEPYFHRRFRRGETREVRLYLHGGEDRVSTRGRGGPIRLRVIGGDGNDVVDDSAGGHTRISDSSGQNRVITGPGTRLDTRPYVPPPPNPRAPWIPPRDWGHRILFAPWLGGGPEVGAFLGGGLQIDRYGFRQHPYASHQLIRAGYATAAKAFRVEYEGEFRRANRDLVSSLSARASGIDVLRFYGFGNETSSSGPDSFFRVKQQQYAVFPALSFPLGGPVRLSLGPTVKYADTKLESGRFITSARPYGVGTFGEAGATARLRVDTRDVPAAARHGALFETTGTFYPAVWDVKSAFGELHADTAGYLSAGGALQPTLALRAGGKRVWGTYPFHEAAFVGGGNSVRGFRAQRFAGDSAAWGNAELRLFLTKFFLVLPGELGVFGLGDGGRVWLAGESSDRWHTAVGGGVWFAFLNRANTVTVTVARSDERTGVYVRGGFAF
ncbi:MAG TPA: hypothetical protein VGQ78_09715 [Vicinamibacteria bacterium]|nr:hypothetical protein [Vicinamibacteria bacterium]